MLPHRHDTTLKNWTIPSQFYWERTITIGCIINAYNAGLGFTELQSVFPLKYLIFRLFHELINQYQACLYSFECISHGDFKYGHNISQLWHFFYTFVKLCAFSDIILPLSVWMTWSCSLRISRLPMAQCVCLHGRLARLQASIARISSSLKRRRKNINHKNCNIILVNL